MEIQADFTNDYLPKQIKTDKLPHTWNHSRMRASLLEALRKSSVWRQSEVSLLLAQTLKEVLSVELEAFYDENVHQVSNVHSDWNRWHEVKYTQNTISYRFSPQRFAVLNLTTTRPIFVLN